MESFPFVRIGFGQGGILFAQITSYFLQRIAFNRCEPSATVCIHIISSAYFRPHRRRRHWTFTAGTIRWWAGVDRRHRWNTYCHHVFDRRGAGSQQSAKYYMGTAGLFSI